MKLVLTLLVRDEADVIDANVRYHLNRGVDHVIATDNCSSDGTRDVLAAYQDAGVLTLWDEPSLDYDQSRWVTRMARAAAADLGADWVINADADELWWPSRGDLKAVLEGIPADVGVVEAPVLNFVDDGSAGRARSRGRSPFAAMAVRHRLRDKLKVAHRGRVDVMVGFGNHRIDEPDLPVLADRTLLSVLHYPARGYEQYEQKIRSGGAAITSNPALSERLGVHWRDRYERYRRGELAAWYAEHLAWDRHRCLVGLARRELVLDRRARRFVRLLDEGGGWDPLARPGAVSGG